MYSEADMLELAASLGTAQLYREAVTRGQEEWRDLLMKVSQESVRRSHSV